MTVLVEAAVESLDDALAAVAGGAGRLELCANLDIGGTTPSAALDRRGAREGGGARPRHDPPARRRLRATPTRSSRACTRTSRWRARSAHRASCSACSTPSTALDLERTAALVEAAEGLPVTFHRAIDQVARRVAAIDALAALGVARVLSSGGAGTASEGPTSCARWCERAGDRLTVVAGGGVRAHNARDIVERTGVTEVHARCGGDAERIRGIVEAVKTATTSSG